MSQIIIYNYLFNFGSLDSKSKSDEDNNDKRGKGKEFKTSESTVFFKLIIIRTNT